MTSTTRLLLVEDDSLDAEVVCSALKLSADTVYDVYTARTLADAFKQLCEASFDVVLLDLGLPDGLGLNGLKKMVRILESPVIVLTGNDNQRLVDEAMLQGAHDFVAKSENLSVVLEKTIRFAVQRYQALVAITRTEGLRNAHYEFSRFQSSRIQKKLDFANKLAAFAMHTNQCVAIIDSTGNIEWANAAFYEYSAVAVRENEELSLFEIDAFANAFWSPEALDSLAKTREFCMTRVVDTASDNSRVVNVEIVPFAHDNTGTQKFTFSYFEKSLRQSTEKGGSSFASKTILAGTFPRSSARN